LKNILFVYIVLCAHSLVQAQETRGRFFLEVGAVARTTIFYRHNAQDHTSILHVNAPFDYRAGVNGTGLQVTPGIELIKSVRLHAGTTLRYDVYRINSDNSREHTFYVDEYISGAGIRFIILAKRCRIITMVLMNRCGFSSIRLIS
jgi:hypothetical protein